MSNNNNIEPMWRIGPFTVRRNSRDPDGVTISVGEDRLHITADQWDSIALLVEDEIRGKLGKLVSSDGSVTTPAKWGR